MHGMDYIFRIVKTLKSVVILGSSRCSQGPSSSLRYKIFHMLLLFLTEIEIVGRD